MVVNPYFRGNIVKMTFNILNPNELMSEERFWQLVEDAKPNRQHRIVAMFRKAPRYNYTRHQQQLKKALMKLAPQQIVAFNNRLRQLQGQANDWQLWGAIYLINNGCGDDCFGDFRGWVVAQGRDFYYKTINDPDTLGELDKELLLIDWEGFSYVPMDAMEALTGSSILTGFEEQQEIKGAAWDSDDTLRERYPRIAARYI